MLNIDLAGKTAIVTGSSAGIGWGCARALAQAGATVVLVARRPEALAEARGRLTSAVPGASVRTVAADLGEAAGCASLAAAEARCDILVNNLGLYQAKPFFDTSDADWHRLFDINLMAGIRLSQAYMPGMMESGWGRVIFFSSVNGLIIPTDALHYGVMKAGVLALSRGLAKLAGRSGVTVNAVLPGVTGAEWVKELLAGMAEQSGQSVEDTSRAAVVAQCPASILQRVQDVEEVANLVAYLCSPLSSATTGSALRADGGAVEAIF